MSDSDPSDLPPAVVSVLDAVREGDQSAFVEAFTESGVVDDNGRRFVGSNAIRRWSEAKFIGRGGRMEVTGSRPTDSGVALDVNFSSSGFNGYSRFDFEVGAGGVETMRITA